MPISLAPISRRELLAGSAAAAAALAAGRLPGAEKPQTNPHRVALLADTHVSFKRDQVVRGTNMFANLKKVGGELLALDERPAAVLVNGDCAYLAGLADDYAALVELARPIREGGLPLHFTMGNHDHRQRFWKAVTDGQPKDSAVMDRHVTIVPTERANWLLLDSLDRTNHTPGTLGEKQLAWLAGALDARADKPAIVLAHHNPDEKPPLTGLTDTTALRKVLQPRKHVKAFIFGHTHNWNVRQHDGLWEVNLPPVAYVFAPGKPNGWVDCHLTDSSATIELHAIDAGHKQNGEKHELKWRT